MADKGGILFLTKYARNGASSRYRTFQYLPWLERAGVPYQLSALFDERYLAHLYCHGHGQIADIAKAYLRRVLILLELWRFDLVVIEKELLPYLPAFAEHCLAGLGIKYVVDYDDALFHQYDNHRHHWVRRLLAGKIAAVIRGATLVTVGNRYLADYAIGAGARRVEIVPTVVDLDNYRFALPEEEGGQSIFTIGWIGSPTTARYLQSIAPALAAACANGEGRVVLVGSGATELPGVPLDVVTWREATEVEQLRRFDVGIMPLPDEPWARGKCGFKLIQYMACSLPVVASPVGVNRELVQFEENGLLAANHSEWQQALERFKRDSAFRQSAGRSGRYLVERQYSLQVTAPRMLKLWTEAMAGRS